MRSVFIILLVFLLLVAGTKGIDPEKKEVEIYDSNEEDGGWQEDPGEGYPSNEDFGDDEEGGDAGDDDRKNYRNAPPKADETHPDYPQELERPKNKVEFTIFVALRPNSQSVGHALTRVLNPFLNLVDMAFRNTYQFLDSKEEWPSPSLFRRPLVYLRLMPNLEPDRLFFDEYNSWTWWKYEFTYRSFEAGTYKPTNSTTTEEAQADVEDYLDVVMLLKDLFQDFMDLAGFMIFQVQMEDPRLATEKPTATPPVLSNSTFAPSEVSSEREWSKDPTTQSPSSSSTAPSTPSESPKSIAPSLNPFVATATLPPTSAGDIGENDTSTDIGKERNSTLGVTTPDAAPDWRWQRCVGLGLLLGTVLGTICLSQIAAVRRHRRDKEKEWANLATEEGVDEILRTGWKINGSRIEIFDITKRGQRRYDDSMLVGGFQPSGIAVGGEINVKKASEGTHRETAVNSSYASHESP